MISTAIGDGVLTVTLNRPEARNALNGPGYAAFDEALRTAAADPAIVAVLVNATGPHFCAGQDLREVAQLSAAEIGSSPFYPFIENLGTFGKPVIAAVEGDAIGVGMTMLLYVDFVVASTTARFRTPFVSLGSTAEAGSSLMLSSALGPRQAARMLYLGDWLSATDPAAAGLVHAVVPGGQALQQARELSQRLVASSGAALAATKRLLVAAREDALAGAFERERAELLGLLEQPELIALLRSFSEGRAARR